MSWQDCPQAERHDTADGAIELVLSARASEVGGFAVRRALPSRHRRMVGPFVFLDQMGPSEFEAGRGLDVRPHPHIGLATVTFLFDGEILHRDSLGHEQLIRPGEVNWMTAGRGIAHSERTPEEARRRGGRLFGIQAWVALPLSDEEAEPDFTHHAADTLPVVRKQGLVLRVLAGELFGERSPVQTFTETFYADVSLDIGAELTLDAGYAERAVYVAHGEIEIQSEGQATGKLVVLRPGAAVSVKARSPSRVLLLGGEPMDGPRFIWWNFVSSRRERIERAKSDWKAGRFGSIPGESDFIPLPDLPGP